MKEFISKDLAKAITKDVKRNEALIKGLADDASQYGANNSEKILQLKQINTSLNELLK